jgi:polyisoprenyl-teichoic acid--peptidoglycan teichoic acid transferase
MTDISNFKYSKKPNQHNHRTSVDGFISAKNFKKQSDFDYDKHGNRVQPDPEPINKLDDFNRVDGYQPTVPALTGSEPQTQLLSDRPRNRAASDTPPHQRTKKKRRLRIFRKPKSWKKFFLRTFLLLLVIFLIVAGYLGYKAYKTQRSVFGGGGKAPAICNGDVPLDKLQTEGDSRVNILLLGIGGPEHQGGNLTDTIIIASVDTINDSVELLSIPRDLWVRIPGNGSQKINAAYQYGLDESDAKGEKEIQKDAIELVDKTVSSVTGIKIHYNAVVNFKAFEDVVNALGGVDVNVSKENAVTETLWIEGTSRHYYLNVKPGTQHFDGTKALYYARSRYTSARGDFDRSERQRLMLVAMKDKAMSLGTYSNPLKVSQLLDSLGNNVYTDFDINDAKCLYKQASEIPSNKIRSLDLVTPPNDLIGSGNINGLSTLVPKAGVNDYSKIQSFVRNAMKDSYLKRENAKVTILNGTNIPGLATQASEVLKSYGYNVGTVGDAPTHNYQKTTLVYVKKENVGLKKYTQHYLQNRLGVKAVDKMPDTSINSGGADFVIILGTDAINKFQN